MTLRRLLVILWLIGSAGAASVAADELQQPRLPSADGVAAVPPVPADCPALPPVSRLRAASLILRNTVRPDVGPYQVKLPGYASGEDSSKDRYAPYVIEAEPGDTLRIDLDNRLDASAEEPGVLDASNLHVHGMIVNPTPPSRCVPPGDYIFISTRRGAVTNYRIDIPASLSGAIGFGQRAYPSGLYWFHSHMHEASRDQVMAGQAGLLSIVSPSGSAGAADPTAQARAGARSRYMALRDIQLSVPPGRTPDKAVAGESAEWLSGELYDTQACRAGSNPGLQMFSGPGFCGHAKLYDAMRNISDGDHDTVWLFTINGQRYPDVTIQAGKTELWRIANLSPTVTYSLTLVDAAGELQDMQLMTLDGVIAGMSDAESPGQLRPRVVLKRVLLMPAARAEIIVPNTNTAPGDQDAVLTLRSQGLETGGVQDASVSAADYVGDPWPPVDLARVIMKAGAGLAPQPDLLSATFVRSGAPSAAPSVTPAAAAVPANCVTLASSDDRRRITFAEADPNIFKLGSEVVDRSGVSIDGPDSAGPHTIAPAPFAHVMPPESVQHVCARLGATEVWELVNTTNELHNFHIHQSKFRLARAGDPGAPATLSAATVFQDPGGVLIDQMPELADPAAVPGIDVWHDTIPVPPADAAGHPGVVFIAIPFTDPHQVGTFVFHCHILEHEDGGMMATVQVFDPKQSAALPPSSWRAAATDGADYCGSPPPELQTLRSERNFSEVVRDRVLASMRTAARAFDWHPGR